MKLIDYAKQKGGTATLSCPVLATVAAAAECSVATLYLIARGHKRPSPRLAGRISDATQCVVTRSDLLPEIFGAPVASTCTEAVA